MAQEQSVQIGSGTVPFVATILPTTHRGVDDAGLGLRRGTQVIVANPEDLNSVAAFATSGVTVGTGAAIEIVGPHLHNLPHTRKVTIQNTDTTHPVFVGSSPDSLTLVGFRLAPIGDTNSPNEITLELLHNVSVYAIATGGSADVRFVVL